MTTTNMREVAQVAQSLRDDDVHVWRMDYQRVQRRLPLLTMLGQYLGIPVAEVTLIEAEHGRPHLHSSHQSSLGFNWSHSGDVALLAIGRHLSPGIDIEIRRHRPRSLDIAEQYFRPEEYASLIALPEAQRGDAFLELWTAKEAVLKAIGRGIAFGLDRLAISHVMGQPVLTWLDDDDAATWQLARLDIDDACMATLAWRGLPRQIHCWRLTLP